LCYDESKKNKKYLLRINLFKFWTGSVLKVDFIDLMEDFVCIELLLNGFDLVLTVKKLLFEPVHFVFHFKGLFEERFVLLSIIQLVISLGLFQLSHQLFDIDTFQFSLDG
jgi:hypothetical protein